MRIASIDIGTNTILLLIVDIDKHGNIVPVHHIQQLPRIGKDVDEKRNLQPLAFQKTLEILKEYQSVICQFKADKSIVCATSAVRDAANKDEFVSYIQNETGIQIEILSGDDEAYLTYIGAISGLPPSQEGYVVIDIGGGSTEISYSLNDSYNLNKTSLQIGSVRLSERYFKHNPPLAQEVKSASDYITGTLSEHNEFKNISCYQLVGVAGTVTTLACLEQNLMEFDVNKVSGFILTHEIVHKWFENLSMLRVDEIRTLSNTTEGRADILLAGTLILLKSMEYYDFKEVVVTERGLRYGLALRELKTI